MRMSRSVMLHSANAAFCLRLCGLDNKLNRPSIASESSNIRKKLGLFVLHSIITLAKLRYLIFHVLGSSYYYKVALLLTTQEGIQSMEQEIVCQG